jgi:transposase
MGKTYPTDLSDTEWQCIETHVPPPNKRGHTSAHTARQILDASFYVLRAVVHGGCCLEFPSWKVDGAEEGLAGGPTTSPMGGGACTFFS